MGVKMQFIMVALLLSLGTISQLDGVLGDAAAAGAAAAAAAAAGTGSGGFPIFPKFPPIQWGGCPFKQFIDIFCKKYSSNPLLAEPLFGDKQAAFFKKFNICSIWGGFK